MMAVRPGCPTPPRPGGAVDTSEVYETAEVMPELIGGLGGLMERVVYPEDAQEEGVEGQVVVRFVVDAGGAVADPEVLRSPDPRLSEAALDAVRASRFTPGRVGGEPVRVRFALPVVFRLAADVPGGAGAAQGAQGEGRGGDLVGGDFVVHDLDLVYPDDARREGVAGTVVVALAVDAEGRAVDPVVTASPDDRLSSAALDALRGARFSPAPTAGRVEVPVTFAIDPPAAPPAGGEVSETFETPPVLIGGMPWLTGNVEYPESARRAGVEGQVVVRFVVGETGEIRDVRVASSPDPRLSQAALQAVHAARFRPATRDGRPVAVEFAVPVTFRVR